MSMGTFEGRALRARNAQWKSGECACGRVERTLPRWVSGVWCDPPTQSSAETLAAPEVQTR
eukprot:3361566-Rhodomonas_salina.2